jgi:hypothetical protein
VEIFNLGRWQCPMALAVRSARRRDRRGPLILVPFAGMLAAFLIYDSDWRRPRKTELEGWMHLGLFAGFAMMFILMWAFCAKSAN